MAERNTMNEVDRYLILLAATARELVEQGRIATDFMDQWASHPSFRELVDLRCLFFTSQDQKQATGLLDTGLFSDMKEEDRPVALVISHELKVEISKFALERRFRKYTQQQPLFARSPDLWPNVLNDELISTSQVRQIGESSIVDIPGGWGCLDGYLPGRLFSWVRGRFGGVPIYIRLDPWSIPEEQPTDLSLLQEETIRPVRSGWWEGLSLRKRKSDSGQYVLQAPVGYSPERKAQWWEYHTRHVRSLEIHAHREDNDYLTMTIEELAYESPYEDTLIGRCIHCDTDAASGTSAGDASLIHIDLAINIYFRETASHRMKTPLRGGGFVEADVRTHLLRAEGVPFQTSAEFARQFFLSSVLLKEWMQDQFGESPDYLAEG